MVGMAVRGGAREGGSEGRQGMGGTWRVWCSRRRVGAGGRGMGDFRSEGRSWERGTPTRGRIWGSGGTALEGAGEEGERASERCEAGRTYKLARSLLASRAGLTNAGNEPPERAMENTPPEGWQRRLITSLALTPALALAGAPDLIRTRTRNLPLQAGEGASLTQGGGLCCALVCRAERSEIRRSLRRRVERENETRWRGEKERGQGKGEGRERAGAGRE